MHKACYTCVTLAGLLLLVTFSTIQPLDATMQHVSQNIVDLVENWNFTESEYGGWEGNEHTNISKPTHWKFSGETEGPKEHYQLINDTTNGGDADTLYARPTRTNKMDSILIWQDFTPTNINNVTIQHRSRVNGPCALILLYGLNDSVAADTLLPNGSLPYLTCITPTTNTSASGYWTNYTTYTIQLTNLNHSYHHYRLHWQVTDVPGKPDAELYIAYCRITESIALPPTPPPTLPPESLYLMIPIIAFIGGIIALVVIGIIYLKRQGKLKLPSFIFGRN